jgi:hypothetical protein
MFLIIEKPLARCAIILELPLLYATQGSLLPPTHRVLVTGWLRWCHWERSLITLLKNYPVTEIFIIVEHQVIIIL